MVTGPPLLDVQGLAKHYRARSSLVSRRRTDVPAVDGIDFTITPGETLGLVGESGCGKTTTARIVTRLVAPTAGRVAFEGQDVWTASGTGLAAVRRHLQMVFQDPYSALNPRRTVGDSVAMPLWVNRIKPPGGVRGRVRETFELVGLDPAYADRYPHEFSGGQRQRIGIARALVVEPRLVVADEPVSALDVSIQAQILNLLGRLQRELGLAYLFIAHDLAVVRHLAQRVAVMYLGRIVEVGPRDAVYGSPAHPYTRALLSAVPDIGPVTRDAPGRIRLAGAPTQAGHLTGCRFRDRCWKAQDRCETDDPALSRQPAGQFAACHFPEPPGTPGSQGIVPVVLP